jgi:hypothetical protein
MTTSKTRFGLVDSHKGVEGKDLNCEEEEWDKSSKQCMCTSVWGHSTIFKASGIQWVTERWTNLPLPVSLFQNLSFNLTIFFILYVTTKILLHNAHFNNLVLKYLENLNRNKLIKIHYKHDNNEEYDHRRICIGWKTYNSYILNTLYLMPVKNIGMLTRDLQIWSNT